MGGRPDCLLPSVQWSLGTGSAPLLPPCSCASEGAKEAGCPVFPSVPYTPGPGKGQGHAHRQGLNKSSCLLMDLGFEGGGQEWQGSGPKWRTGLQPRPHRRPEASVQPPGQQGPQPASPKACGQNPAITCSLEADCLQGDKKGRAQFPGTIRRILCKGQRAATSPQGSPEVKPMSFAGHLPQPSLQGELGAGSLHRPGPQPEFTCRCTCAQSAMDPDGQNGPSP